MITKEDFEIIWKEVEDSIRQTLNKARSTSLGNYVLFLALGEQKETKYVCEKEEGGEMVRKGETKMEAPTIDTMIELYRHKDRSKFLFDFLNTYYTFPTEQSSTNDDKQRITLELMIYTHIWESKPFIKSLDRLAHIANGGEYKWSFEIPKTRRSSFISKIRENFEKSESKIADIIRKGLNSPLRNSFAHSDYYLDSKNSLIWLLGYKELKYEEELKNKEWEPESIPLENISFDDWSKRFAYSVLLFHLLWRLMQEKRKSLVSDCGTNQFPIRFPKESNNGRGAFIIYDTASDSFFSK